MSKKRKSKRAQRKSRVEPPQLYDHRRGDTITVAWVVSTLACALAGLIGAIGIYLTRGENDTDDHPDLWQGLTPLMLFIAAITGLMVICITPLVYIFRRTAPPLAITVVALCVAAFPLIALVVLASKS
jgi:hypothetical protein